MVVMDEAQALPTEGHEPVHRRRGGAQRRRAEEKGLLTGPFILVEQYHHQARPTAEAAEHGAFADAGLGSDVVHRDGVGAALVDQAAGRLQQQRPIACRVAALVRKVLRGRHGQLAQPLDSAHHCTLTRSE